MTELEIYNEMIAQKAATPELNALSSNSPTANWKAICRFFAGQLSRFWTLVEQSKIELLAIVDARQAGTIEWYRYQILNWQRGHEMRFIGSAYRYETIDPEARIVAKCAVEETRNALLIKVAQMDNNVLKPLTINDLNALRAYASRVKFAGTRLSIVSHRADLVTGIVTIHHNPELNGLNTSIRCTAALKEALNRHEFNGRLRLSAIVDLLQSVRGVSDVSGLNIVIDSGVGTFDVQREYIARSGYFELSPHFIIQYEPYL
jgi:hypothetical protein